LRKEDLFRVLLLSFLQALSHSFYARPAVGIQYNGRGPLIPKLERAVWVLKSAKEREREREENLCLFTILPLSSREMPTASPPARPPSITGKPSPSADDYSNFFTRLNLMHAANKTLFWSGTAGSATVNLAHRLSDEGRRFVALEDTESGFFMEDLVWCGDQDRPGGISNTTCPKNSTDGFWVRTHDGSTTHLHLLLKGQGWLHVKRARCNVPV